MSRRPKNQIGDGPISPEMHEVMNDLARFLDGVLNNNMDERKVGFVLLTFPFGLTDGRCNYISNGAREDIKVMFREQLARWEGQISQAGRA